MGGVAVAEEEDGQAALALTNQNNSPRQIPLYGGNITHP